MNPRLEAWRFVSEALAPNEDAAAIAKLRRRIERLDGYWAYVTRLADAHLVTPALCVSLKRKGLIDDVPEVPRQYLESLYQMNAARTAALRCQLDETIAILNSRGIVPVLLKGAAYLKCEVFSDPAERIFSDLDLLVSESQIPAALEVLEAAGYRPVDDRTDYSNHWHCTPLSRPGAYATLEVHRKLAGPEWSRVLPTSLAVPATSFQSEEGLRYRCLPPTDMAALSFLHSQVIDRFGETFTLGLRPIHDALALHNTYKDRIDWERIDVLLMDSPARSRYHAYLFAVRRITGVRLFPRLRFGPGPRGHFAVAHARIRWRRISRLSLHECTNDWFRRKKGVTPGFLRLAAHRAGFVFGAMWRRLQWTSSVRNTP